MIPKGKITLKGSMRFLFVIIQTMLKGGWDVKRIGKLRDIESFFI